MNFWKQFTNLGELFPSQKKQTYTLDIKKHSWICYEVSLHKISKSKRRLFILIMQPVNMDVRAPYFQRQIENETAD